MRKKLLAGIGAAASGIALTAASVFGLSATAHADYVSPEALSSEGSGWFAEAWSEVEEYSEPGFDQCSVILPEFGGGLGFVFDGDSAPAGSAEVTAMIQSFYANVTQGGGTLGVLIDVLPEGIADVFLEIPVGLHGVDLDAPVSIQDSPDLGLPEGSTTQDVLDALDERGGEYRIYSLQFSSDTASAVQWLAFGDETYWFGTDAEWFLNDPSCGSIPDPKPEPQPNPAPSPDAAPKVPVRVDTGV